VVSITLLAQQSGYTFAGVLTVIAAAIVTVVILVGSGANHDDIG